MTDLSGEAVRQRLRLLEAQGQSRAVLTLESDDTPIIRFLDAQGHVIWSVP